MKCSAVNLEDLLPFFKMYRIWVSGKDPISSDTHPNCLLFRTIALDALLDVHSAVACMKEQTTLVPKVTAFTRLVLDIREGTKNHSVGSRAFLLDTLGTTVAPVLSLNCFSVAEVLEEENAFSLSLSRFYLCTFLTCLELHESNFEHFPLVNHWLQSPSFSITTFTFPFAFSFNECSTCGRVIPRIEISIFCL